MRRARWAPIVLVTLTGCPDDPPAAIPDAGPPTCADSFVGNPDEPLEFEITQLDAQDEMKDLVEGGDVDLIEPPQGGLVIFLGVRAKNLDPNCVRLQGVIRDPETTKIMFDTRTVPLRTSDDGYATSNRNDITTFANVPVCANHWASTDAYDLEFEIEVSLTDQDGRKAKRVTTAIPRCAEPEHEALCQCICRKDYVTGMECNDSDAGAGGVGGGT